MRILVIGGCGFIGSHVVDLLLAAGHKVTVLDRYPERFRIGCPGATYVFFDYGDKEQLETLLAESTMDAVVHLVSTTIPQSSNEDPLFDIQSNLVQSLVLFDLCIKHKIKKIIFLSSGGTVYGTPLSSPMDEQHPTLPQCSYGITKLAIENYLYLYHLLHGLDYTVLRVSNPYGTRQDPHRKQGAPAVFMHKMLVDEVITIWGDGSIVRDYVYVSDVAKACLAAIASSYVGVCNIGSGLGLSLKELLYQLQEVTGRSPTIDWHSSRNFDVPTMVLDCSKADRELGWRPRVEMRAGLAEMRDWMSRDLLGQSREP
jgi:UDP-glucose 4-epimerase